MSKLVDIQSLVDQVLMLCPEADPADVRKDLEFTKSADLTINKILDGQVIGVDSDEEDLPSASHILNRPHVVDIECSSSDTYKSNKNLSGQFSSSKSSSDSECSIESMPVLSKKPKQSKASDFCSADSDIEAETVMNNDDAVIDLDDSFNDSSDLPTISLKSRILNQKDINQNKEKYNNDNNFSDDDLDLPSLPKKKRISLNSAVQNQFMSLENADWDDDLKSISSKGKINLDDDKISAKTISDLTEESNAVGTNYKFHEYSKSAKRARGHLAVIDGNLTDDNTECSQESSATCHSVTSCTSVSAYSELDSQDVDGAAKVRRKKRTPEEIAESKRLAQVRKAEREKEKIEKQKLKAAEKQLKDAEKARKDQEKHAKRSELQQEKNKKQAVIHARRVAKPGECTKFLTTYIDSHIIDTGPTGVAILTTLQAADYKYQVMSQHVPNCITWKRQVMDYNLGDDIQLSSIQSEVLEDEVVLLLPVKDFIAMVNAYKMQNHAAKDPPCQTLMQYASDLKASVFPGKNLTFIVQGVEKYFRDQKTSANRAHRKAVLASEGQGHPELGRKQKKLTNVDVLVTRVDMEEAMIDLQIHTGVNVKLAEAPDEVAAHVKAIAKAVAEAPFKRERLRSIFTFHADSTGAKKVDKEGRGLLKVWQMQIQQLNNVGPEMANAIISAYPSPNLLIQAYRKCSSTFECERLLENVTVRRGAGVLETSRRIGKELSRKIYHIMMNTDPNFVIK